MAKTDKKAKTTAKADAPARFVFNPSALQKVFAQLSKVIGKTENIELHFGGTKVVCYVETTKGRIALTDETAITEGEGNFALKVPAIMWINATKGRPKLTLEKGTGDKRNYAILTAPRYSSELHYSAVEFNFEVKLDKGVSAGPVIELATNCGKYLALTDYVQNVNLDINMRWSKDHMEASMMDNYHAIICEGNINKTQPGALVLPPDMFFNLVEMGGEIGFSGKSVAAISEKGQVELAQVDSESLAIPIDKAVKLLKNEFTSTFVISGPEFWTLLTNAMDVSEVGNHATFGFTAKGKQPTLDIQTTGRYGNVKGQIEIHDVTGKLPATISLNPVGLMQLGHLFDGNMKISLFKNIIRIDPVTAEKGAWTVTGFVVLTVGE